MVLSPYSAAVATFRRPVSLGTVLEGLAAQKHPPCLIVVADNDPDRSAEAVVATFAATSTVPVSYLPLDQNTGPAGAWAAAVGHASRDRRRGDWVAIFDDDDPVSDPRVMAALAARAEGSPSEVAGVGLRGARIRRFSATLCRVEGMDTVGQSVDYLASGGAPLYRWGAVDAVGFFDPQLFFGFEDLELGLRLRHRGMRLMVESLGEFHVVADTAPVRTPWREYFKTRSLVVICRRHLGPVALALTMLRTLLLGAPQLVANGGWQLLRARWAGAADGLRHRLGPGAWAPSENPEKRPTSPGQDGSSNDRQA